MAKNRNKKTAENKITVSGNIPRPGQTAPATIIINQPQRFGIDISTYMTAIRGFENVDFTRRTRLYDLYSDILMDAHLTSVINKRRNAILSSSIEFHRDGKPDEIINQMLSSPWFYSFISDAWDSILWGCSLAQFFRDGNYPDYDLIPRKHVDPVKKLILRHQTDINGTPWDDYSDLLFIGKEDNLGLLAQAAPYVIYKRNTMGDWAQFSEIFGMPIRDYTYDTSDEDLRSQLIQDAMEQGSNAVYIHPKDSGLNLIESGNKSGSSDLYNGLKDACNAEISKLILGNTLTTEAGNKGTQALGTVHKEIEDEVTAADKRFILNVLNYNLFDILNNLGFSLDGGEFVFVQKENIDTTKQAEIVVKMNDLGLPLDHDYLYETFGIKKPDNYDALLKQKEDEKLLQQKKEQEAKDAIEKAKKVRPVAEPFTNQEENTFFNRLKSFFAQAPKKNGAEDW
nr:DUF935 family protein [uncultured Bacteroides sp.]